jgi:hypothetical protein
VAVAALLLFGAACGDGGSGGDEDAAGPSPTAAPVGPTAATQPALTSLAGTATCGDYVRATQAARENATRAALIVVRHDAGVEREPSARVRAEFEKAVDAACALQPALPMLDVMAAVAGEHPGAYLG